jgi:hypothetical protein
MDVRSYFQFFWIPAIASAGLLTIRSAQEGLSGRVPLLLGWFLSALVTQYLAPIASAWWIAGFVLQAALAVLLLSKHRFDSVP